MAPGLAVPGGGRALAFSWVVELAQLTPLPAALSEASVVARLVLGSTFGAADLLAYAAGAVLAASAHALLLRRRVILTTGERAV
ncbi:DUF2809 domain-containing protein [Streptosporangium lutulentum]